MFSWDKPEDRVAVAQMNSELQHAQLELLSAHCSTHQLRLRYSPDDLARFGRRDLLRKAVRTANALSEYYSSIEKHLPPTENIGDSLKVTEDTILGAAHRVSAYLQEQRERFYPAASPLSQHLKTLMWPYFPASLLERVKTVELEGDRLPPPSFYDEYRKLGFVNLPEVTHMHSVTFIDVIVFNERLTERALFHGLVHAVQIEILGLERYCDFFVRSFANTKHHFSVPLEAHAFSLESKFAGTRSARFSVEENVRLWARDSRY
ncbi:MAG TPA: hypothetical protein VND65_15615 [Candidatus Binatia bacterium]|nr:hypothetical protein [Candidatus Binatia bacterium]